MEKIWVWDKLYFWFYCYFNGWKYLSVVSWI